jgi:hypothetical protein
MVKQWQGGLVAAGTFLFLALVPIRAADAPGTLWQMTSQMVMQGMPFSPPPNTVNVCTANTWTKPPPGGDKSCVNSNFHRAGNRATWDMQCSGQMPMTGHGEITFEGTDSYTGAINATAEGVAVTIKLAGKKLGTCDKPTG